MKLVKGNLVYSPRLGELVTLRHGALLLDESGAVEDVLPSAPEGIDAEVSDWGDALIMPSFVDMHLHAPQYPMLGLGMDLPLMDWLNTYTFKTESRFSDTDYARRIYRRLARDLITGGTTRVCMFSSLHTDATIILMEELERAGVTGYVGKVNMDRNSGEDLRESTEESKRETLRWLESCASFRHVNPILTPRFTPSCTDELMAWLGRLAEQRGLYVQSHLSENEGEIALVRKLHPDCGQYWETYEKYGLWKDHTVMAHPKGAGGAAKKQRSGGTLRGFQPEHLQRHRAGAYDAPRGRLGDAGLRYRGRCAAGDESGCHHEHPCVEGALYAHGGAG